MLEIAPSRVAVIRCFGAAGALDTLRTGGAAACRIAPDELWLVTSPRDAGEIARQATTHLSGADPDGLVLDHSEAFAAWLVRGNHQRDAFARLADFPLPPPGRFAQGAVAQVPAKIRVHGEAIELIVPVQLAHHIPERLADACPDLAPTLGSAADFDAGTPA